jgi:hypothetical protein
MLKGGLLQLVAYGYIPFTQSFKGDVTKECANEYGDDIAILTLDRLIGRVNTLLFNPFSKDFVTKEYQGIDVTGLRIGLVMGYRVVIKVETRDDVLAAYQLLGVKEENGKVKVVVKAIGEGTLAVISQKKIWKNEKMEISLAGIAPIAYFTALADLPRFWSWSSDAIQARYDSIKERLIFANDQPPGQAIFYSAAARENLTILEFKSSSSSGEGEVIKVVAKVECVKVDGEGYHVKLSNKGIKGEGMTARKATKALDGLKSRNYSVRVGPLADAFDIEGGGFGAQFWSSIGLDVEDGALLKKKRKVGLFELEFKTKDSDRILYKDGDTVRSKTVKSYLSRVAGNYDEPFHDDSNECKWWVCDAPRIVAMKTASGESVLGVLTDLRWSVNNDLWIAKVGLSFTEAERFQKKSKIIGVEMVWQ